MEFLWLLAGILGFLVVLTWIVPEGVLEALGRRVKALIWEDVDLHEAQRRSQDADKKEGR